MFITFEGIDGSGKTTIIEKLKKWLNSKKIDYLLTKEPGGYKDDYYNLRKLLLDDASNLSSLSEALLFALDRRIHLEKIIWPALKKNKIVLCDRFVDSSLVYQGVQKKLGFNKIFQLQNLIIENSYPNLTFYFDIDIDNAYQRIKNRNKPDKFETLTSLKLAYKGYQKCINKFKNRFVIINANLDQDLVLGQVINVLKERLKIE
ncbi:MAG: dTMP kinase [Mycoplasma sp.]|nr:dTMP kinase [Mycoplasma sp.]